jgi:transcriptional antiterminator NusG
MLYYAIQVRTSEEDDFIRRASASPTPPHGRFFSPKRLVPQYRKGKKTKRLLPVFPGYVFFETETLEHADRWVIRRTEGFFRFLKSSLDPSPLSERDKGMLLHFISLGKYADISKVTFDENDRIVVHEGPLKGLEGSIVKVDRRRGRAKVALDICSNGFLVDFGFELVEKVIQGGGDTHDGERT